MRCSLHIALALLAPLVASGSGWTGFPLAEARNLVSFEQAFATYHSVSQLLAAVEERCEVAGIAAPAIVETWTCWAGTAAVTSQAIIATGFGAPGADGMYAVTDPSDTYTWWDGGAWRTNAIMRNGYGWHFETDGTYWDMVPPSGHGLYYTEDGFVSTNWVPYRLRYDAGITTNGAVVTNNIEQSCSVTTTNAVGPFSYSYSNDYASGTATAATYLTQYFMAELDGAIADLFGADVFVCTNEASNGTFDAWFALEDAATNYPSDFPMESMVGACVRLGIGFATNYTADGWGFVEGTNGAAWFTRRSAFSIDWSIAQACYRSGAWQFTQMGTFDKRYYGMAVPVVRYVPAGTNPLASFSITVTGTVLVVSNQSTIATNESVSISATNTAMTLPWYSIAGISGDAPPNTNDVVLVAWTNDLTFYGDWPFVLYAADFDERWRVLNALVWTRTAAAPEAATNATHGTFASSGQYGETDMAAAWARTDTNAVWPGVCVDTAPEPTSLSSAVGTYHYTWPSGYGESFKGWRNAGSLRSGWAYEADFGVHGSYTPASTVHSFNGSVIGTNNFSDTYRCVVPYASGLGSALVYWSSDAGPWRRGEASNWVDSVSYYGALDVRTRKSANVSVMAASTNYTSSRSLYLKGSTAAAAWNGYGSYTAGTWDPEFSPLYSNRFAEVVSDFTGAEASYAYTNMCVTNVPYLGESDLYQKFWGVAGGYGLFKWNVAGGLNFVP